MRKTILLITTVLTTATVALASSWNIGVEAGYDMLDFRMGSTQYHTIKPNGTNFDKFTDVYEVTRAGKYISTYSATTIKGLIPLEKTVKETRNDVGRTPLMHGFHVGPTFDYRFSDKHGLGLRFGLQYQFATTDGELFDSKDERNEHHNTDYFKNYNTTYHGLNIPVRLSYTWELPKDWNIWVMTGPKLNIGLSFKEKFSALNILTGGWDNYVYDYLNGKQYINGDLVNWADPSQLEPKQREIYHQSMTFNWTWGIGLGFGYKNFSFSVLYDIGTSNRYGKGYEAYQNATDTYTDPETGVVVPSVLSVETYEYSHKMYCNELIVSVAYTFPIVKKSVKMTGSHKGEYTKGKLKKMAKADRHAIGDYK